MILFERREDTAYLVGDELDSVRVFKVIVLDRTQQISSEETKADLSAFTPGIFYYRVITNTGTGSGKLVISR